MGKRILTYLNIAVGVLLAITLAGCYWYLYRPLPKTSGKIMAPVSASASVARDETGVPHIQAASIEDALFLQGYVTAQDRLWQMDALRRASAGRISEVIGAAGIRSDREARRLRMERVAEAHYASLTPEDRAPLAAYARGVNHFISTHHGRYPVEFSLLGYDPRPWRVVDSILICLYMFRDLTSTWEYELQKQVLMTGGDRAKVNYLFPVRSGGELHPGSNAWVLSGSRTATGKPILANDPHLDYSIPSIWYMMDIKAPGLNVSGVALPGVPCVILGHNERIAWGVTNLHFDVQDLYVERLDQQTGRYVFEGRLEQARLERELIPVKGSAPVEMAQWVTRHGPVVVAENGQSLALRWVAAEPDFAFPFLELNRARNWTEFGTALARYPGPGQNFVYADVDGNIGYHAAGKLPVRKDYDGDLPVDGSSGKFEWDGYIPFERLPNSYNPPSGIIITANQNPFPADYSYRVNGNFAPPYRSSEINALLSARGGWRAEDMIVVQKDVYSALCHHLAKQAVQVYDRRRVADPNLQEAIDALRGWNGQMEIGSPAPLIATLLYQHIRSAVAEKASPGRGIAYNYQIAPAVVEKLISERPSDWFSDYDQLLLRSFVDAVDEGRRIQGRNIKRWDWGKYNELSIAHPIGGRLRWVGQYFNIGPAPQSGSTTSIKQATRKMGPSMRTAADLSNWDKSYMNIVAGQSGQVLSPHYKDHWDEYYAGRSFPLQFRRIEVKDTLEFEPSR